MLRIISIVGMSLLLQACIGGSSVVKGGAGNVTSSPSGADVYANGVKIGTTPLQKDLYGTFPTGWRDRELSARGVLMLKKPGCEDFVHEVNDFYLSKAIHVKLKCTGVVMPKPVMQQSQPVMQQKPVKAAPGKGVEGRLQELERLYKKGIINKQEYQAARKRIIGDL